jgi:hypothetical protein
MRIVLGLYAFVERIVDGAVDPLGGLFFGFLTNWGVMFTGISLIASGAIVLSDWSAANAEVAETSGEAGAKVGGTDSEALSGASLRPAAEAAPPATSEPARQLSCVDFRRFAVLLGEIVLPLELVITVVFWALLFDEAVSHATPQGTVANISIHLMW